MDEYRKYQLMLFLHIWFSEKLMSTIPHKISICGYKEIY